MVRAIPVHAESPRYSAPLLFLPELWAPASLWLPMASYLAHRGWEGQLLEFRGTGAQAEREQALLAHLGRLPRPPVLLGHGAGAILALAGARAGAAAAVVLLAPLLPGTAAVRGLARRWDVVAAVLRGRPIPPPRGAAAGRLFGETPAGLDLETGRAVLDVVRGRLPPAGRLGVPALLVAGERDPLLGREAATALAASLGAEFAEIAGAAHWPVLPPGWQQTVAVVHRWLVRRLGEALLDFYADAMAEREADD